MRPAVIVPPDACPHSCVRRRRRVLPRDAPPRAGTGAPVSGEAVPGWVAAAPTYRGDRPRAVGDHHRRRAGRHDPKQRRRGPGDTRPDGPIIVAPTSEDFTRDGCAVICQNVVAVPCAYCIGAEVITDPALFASTCAVSCRGVPDSIAIHMPTVNKAVAAVPAAVVRMVPPGNTVVAVITVPCGRICLIPRHRPDRSPRIREADLVVGCQRKPLRRRHPRPAQVHR